MKYYKTEHGTCETKAIFEANFIERLFEGSRCLLGLKKKNKWIGRSNKNGERVGRKFPNMGHLFGTYEGAWLRF